MRNWLSRHRRYEDLSASIEEHLAEKIDDLIESGLSREEATYAARRQFGNATRIEELSREVWQWPRIETVLADVKFALRQLAKSPAFTVTAVLTLALGIGANTAVFSTLNALLLRMLPVRNPQQLYTVVLVNGGTQPPDTNGTGHGNTSFSFPVFEALRNQKRVFTDLIAHIPLGSGKIPVRYGDTPLAASGEEVSGNFFSGLGVPMAMGTGFGVSDEREHSSTVVLSYGLWTEAFARDASVIGKLLYIKGVPFTIVGVTAPGFCGADPGNTADFWIPLQTRPELGAWGQPGNRGNIYSRQKWWAVPMVARLAPGITPQTAVQVLQPAFWQAATIGLGTLDPKAWPARLGFQPIRGIADYEGWYRTPLEIMMALVGLVLLIASTNVAMLVVARNAAREREFAIRVATGASRARIFAQLITEGALLVLAGAAVGWVLADGATRSLAAWARIDAGLAPDRTVLLFTLGISAAVALAISLVPFRMALALHVDDALKTAAHSSSQSRSSIRVGNIAIALQIAMCFTLLVAAGLTVRTLLNFERQNLGMKADDLLVFDVNPQGLNGNVQAWSFYEGLLQRIRGVPGVEAASIVQWRPGSGWLQSGGISLDGKELRGTNGAQAGIFWNSVGPDYFRTLGVSVLQGRDISEADVPGSPSVAVVNQDFANEFLSSGALGHKLENGIEIVGVVKDSKYRSVVEGKMPTIYYALGQRGMPGQITFEVRAAQNPMALLPDIRRVVHDIDPDLPLQNPMTQAAQFEKSYVTPELFARLAMSFGALAIVLVSVGLCGTLIYRLRRRRSEIGIRVALGALRRDLLWMVLRESLLIAALGVGAGVPLSLLVAHLLRSQLFRLSDLDPASFAAAFVVTFVISAGAGLLPARRAASVDPMQALRSE